MPAPMTTFVPRRADGRPTPGFGGNMGGMGMGMGDMLPMSMVQQGAGAQPWAGPWLSMSQLNNPSPQQQLAQPTQGGWNQGFADWVITGPEVNAVTGSGGSFLTMDEYQAALARQAQAAGAGAGVSGLGGLGALVPSGRTFFGILVGAGLAWMFLTKPWK